MAQALRRFARQRLGPLALGVLVLEAALCLLAPSIAPYNPQKQDLTRALHGPSLKHLMGTDNLGRDVFSRVLFGGRNSLGGASAALLILTVLGGAIGSIAGIAGGVVDMVLMRLTDAILSFPYLVLALGLAAALSPSLLTVILAVSVTWWGHYARVVRAVVLNIKESGYVEAAYAVGAGRLQVLRRHVVPNIAPTALVLAALDFGLVILALAALSYLGLGMQPPTPEWGMMLNEARLYMFTKPHLMIFPGAMIFITVLCGNLFADALRDAFDPSLRTKRM